MSNHPKLICLCGPSASGKSTICKQLLSTQLPVMLSVSTTTREPREGEREGVDYFFVSKEEFKNRIESGAFLEHARYGSNLYGTERSNIEAANAKESHLLLDIDVQGVEQLRAVSAGEVFVIFVAPPSIEILKERFRARPGSTEESLKERMEIAKKELEVLNSPSFSDFKVINNELGVAVLELETRLKALLAPSS